jgi:hypothetical protein
MTAPTMIGASPLALYDGRTCLGFIFARGKPGFEAFIADEKSHRAVQVAARCVERNSAGSRNPARRQSQTHHR